MVVTNCSVVSVSDILFVMIISTDIDTDVLGARGQVALYFHNYWTMFYS